MAQSPSRRSRQPRVYKQSSRANDGLARGWPPEFVDPSAPFSDDEDDDDDPTPPKRRSAYHSTSPTNIKSVSPSNNQPTSPSNNQTNDKAQHLYEMKRRFIMMARETNDRPFPPLTNAWSSGDQLARAVITKRASTGSIASLRKRLSWKTNQIAPSTTSSFTIDASIDQSINQGCRFIIPAPDSFGDLPRQPSPSSKKGYYCDNYEDDDDFGDCFSFLNRFFPSKSRQTNNSEVIPPTQIMRTRSCPNPSPLAVIRRLESASTLSMSSHLAEGIDAITYSQSE